MSESSTSSECAIEQRRDRPHRPRPEAEPDPHEEVASSERLGQALHRVADEPPEKPTLATVAITTVDVGAREDEDSDEPEDDDSACGRELDEPLRARHRGDPDDEEPDEDDEVERAVEDHRAERLPGRHPGCEPEPASAEEVAEPAWEHVVDGDAAHRHLVEAREPDGGRGGDPAPARRLQQVDDPERGDRERDETGVGRAERVPDRVEVGVADGEPEEDEPDGHADERDDGAEPPGRHRVPNLPRARRGFRQPTSVIRPPARA